MSAPDLILLLANVLYATSYVSTRLVLEDVPPATLALLRLVIGGALLGALRRGIAAGNRGAPRVAVGAADRVRIAAMGVVGFGFAFAFSHWGITRSTATNAALLIIVEPISLMALSPLFLGERLSQREALGAAVALLGTAMVVVNGVPGVSVGLVPHWRGDLLLILAGLAYASYSVLGRTVLLRHDALRVTTESIGWGALALLPLTALEIAGGAWPRWSGLSILGVAYLGVVITALGYLVWNYALARVTAPRAAIFLTVQPVVGALLGVAVLGEPLTPFTSAGGALIVLGLAVTVRGGRG